MAQQTCEREEHGTTDVGEENMGTANVGEESMHRADMVARGQLLEVSSSFHCGLSGLKSGVSLHGSLLPLSHLISPTRFYFLIIGQLHDSPNLLAHCIKQYIS